MRVFNVHVYALYVAMYYVISGKFTNNVCSYFICCINISATVLVINLEYHPLLQGRTHGKNWILHKVDCCNKHKIIYINNSFLIYLRVIYCYSNFLPCTIIYNMVKFPHRHFIIIINISATIR